MDCEAKAHDAAREADSVDLTDYVDRHGFLERLIRQTADEARTEEREQWRLPRFDGEYAVRLQIIPPKESTLDDMLTIHRVHHPEQIMSEGFRKAMGAMVADQLAAAIRARGEKEGGGAL